MQMKKESLCLVMAKNYSQCSGQGSMNIVEAYIYVRLGGENF